MRRTWDRVLTTLLWACGLVAVGLFFLILFGVAWKGAASISWSFLTDSIRASGASGGIYYNILGTMILLGTALAVSGPLAFGIALSLGVFLRNSPWKKRLTLLLMVMNGIPSIVFGIFGFLVFVLLLDWGKSWLIGGILLGLIMLPLVAVSLTERIEALPPSYLEAAAGLGLSRAQIIWSVIVPQSVGGWWSASLLGLARVAGETAPIMFTATIFSGATLPQGWRESPVLSLPYHIFVLAQDSFDPATGGKLWGAALVLLCLVFGLSLVALPFRMNLHEEARHD